VSKAGGLTQIAKPSENTYSFREIFMKTAYSVSKAQSNFPRILKEAEDHVISITRDDETLAYLISKERLESLVESLELMSNPKAMRAVRDAKAGKTKYYPLPKDLDEN